MGKKTINRVLPQNLVLNQTKPYMLNISWKNSKGEDQNQFMEISKAGKFAYEMERLGMRIHWVMEKDYIVEMIEQAIE